MRYLGWVGLLPLVALTAAFITACGGGGGKAGEVTPSFSGGPRVAFEQESVDLGRVPLDTQIRYEFRFHNVGNAQLTVRPMRVEVLEGC